MALENIYCPRNFLSPEFHNLVVKDANAMRPYDVVWYWAFNDEMNENGKNRYLEFGPESKMSKEFSQSIPAKEFEDHFRAKYKDNPEGLESGEMDEYFDKFEWGEFFTWGRENSAEQVIGSFQDGTAEVIGDEIVFQIQNTMSLKSLLFGRQLAEFGTCWRELKTRFIRARPGILGGPFFCLALGQEGAADAGRWETVPLD